MNDKSPGLFPIVFPLLFLLLAVISCRGTGGPPAEWIKGKKLAGKEQGLSHISGLVIDDKFAYVTIGGTTADQNEGHSGVRRINLESGETLSLDNGQQVPQSDPGGLAIDDKYIYWNAGGNILRVKKDGGKPEPVATENVGIGIDIALDKENVYWANHGYYSPNSPTPPSPVYAVPKKGGQVKTFSDLQNIPSSVVVDDNYVYWTTLSSVVKQPKSGGSAEVLFQASDKEGTDTLFQDAGNLYFGFRGAGKSRWSIRKIAKQGGDISIVVPTFSLRPIVIDGSNIYFFDENRLTSDYFCRVNTSGGDITKIDTGYAGSAITQSKRKVYFTSLDSIYAYDK